VCRNTLPRPPLLPPTSKTSQSETFGSLVATVGSPDARRETRRINCISVPVTWSTVYADRLQRPQEVSWLERSQAIVSLSSYSIQVCTRGKSRSISPNILTKAQNTPRPRSRFSLSDPMISPPGLWRASSRRSEDTCSSDSIHFTGK
jgi:hypothetical protein